jgi:hypothetical protein
MGVRAGRRATRCYNILQVSNIFSHDIEYFKQASRSLGKIYTSGRDQVDTRRVIIYTGLLGPYQQGHPAMFRMGTVELTGATSRQLDSK